MKSSKHMPKTTEILVELASCGAAKSMLRRLEKQGFRNVRITPTCDVLASAPSGVHDIQALMYKLRKIEGVFQVGTNSVHSSGRK